MSVLLQISDPHFGTERAPVVEALVGLAQRLRPELVVLSGDITQRATAAQFAAARAFTARLAPATVLAIAGNHDVPLFNLAQRLVSPYARFAQAFGAELEPLYASTDWLVIGVKTTRRWRHEHGEVSERQVGRVARQLGQATAAQLRVVVVHQPVAVPHASDRRTLLRGHDLAVHRWAQAGADVVMGGHIHLPYVLPLHGLHAGLARRLWCVQAGTSVSSRVRPPADNSVNVLRRAQNAAGARLGVLERWDFNAQRARFELVDQQTLEMDTEESR